MALSKQLQDRSEAVAAWQRGFAAAPRKVFVGNSQDANWGSDIAASPIIRRSWISSMQSVACSRRLAGERLPSIMGCKGYVCRNPSP